ncbi:MAG: hypothetical protein HC868_17565 [Sphingomonadales bacterium]|nr:hypothetical protein [Sphingomonadales bacterium]
MIQIEKFDHRWPVDTANFSIITLAGIGATQQKMRGSLLLIVSLQIHGHCSVGPAQEYLPTNIKSLAGHYGPARNGVQ